MSRALILHPEAEQDLFDAQHWYEGQRPGLGAEFRSAIDGLLRRIQASPLSYPQVYKNNRRAVVRRFPYLLYFVATPDAVVVLACFHGKRGPAALRSRLGP